MHETFCPCGALIDKNPGYANIYKRENWEFNNYTKSMELVYAECQHGIVIVDKRKGVKHAANKKG